MTQRLFRHTRLRRSSHLAVAIFFCAFLGNGWGQSCPVTTILRVTDKQGRPVVNVRADQLKAEINGNPANVTLLTPAGKPAAILVLDVSGSTKATWKESMAAAKQLLESSGENVATFVFRERIEASAIGRSKSEELLEQLSKQGPPKGIAATALYDTLVEVAGRVTTRNAAIIVISDGGDNASRLSSDATIAKFFGSSWPAVFGLILDYDEPGPRHRDRERFRKIAAASGGLALYPSSASQVSTTTEKLTAIVLGSPFAITLQPSRPTTGSAELKLEFVGAESISQKDIGLLHATKITGCDGAGSVHR
jgi:hypothetical protein